jgi:hypothetical protein
MFFLLMGTSSLSARTTFQTSFDDPLLHAALEDADSAFEAAGGAVRRINPAHDEDRHFLRTVDSDYFGTGDFAFEVSFTNPIGNGIGTIQYIGLGSAVPNANYYNEPGPPSGDAGTGTGSVYLRIHSPDIVDGRIDWAFNYGTGDQIFAEQIGVLATEGAHRARIAVVGDVVTVAIDEQFTGTFAPTISATIDLNAYPLIRTALLSDSHAFFGTALPVVTYDDFIIMPEPSGIVLAVCAGIGRGLCRRRIRRYV